MPELRHPIGPLSDVARALRSGTVRASQLVELAADRHAVLGERLRAYVSFDAAAARQQAREADAAFAVGTDAGPLQGIPCSVKDLYAVAGFPTYAGSPHRLPAAWEKEGPLVGRLRQQLAVITGKTHTVEFAFGGLGTNPHWPIARNPWDATAERVAGGSSAGAGISLLEGSALVALGTDTAGSVRIPASFAGVVGLKTSAGRWPTGGIVPLSPTLDTAGLLARTVADAGFAFEALDGHHAEPSTERTGRRWRLGVPEQLVWDDCGAGVAESVQAALSEIEARGVACRALIVPEILGAHELFLAGGPVAAELWEFLTRELPDWIPTLDPNVGGRLGSAAEIGAAEYEARVERLRELALAVSSRFEGPTGVERVDAWVMPTVPIGAPLLDDVATRAGYRQANLLALRNTALANYLGLCALSLPVGLDASGLPVGLQLLAPHGEERRLLALGIDVESWLGTGAQRLGIPPLLHSSL
ncbi:MAG: amidase [Acidobacteriota bacterium]|nr:MAG: amidase [Acidobacteriota bacterium]